MTKFKKTLLIIHGELTKDLNDRLNETRIKTKKEKETLKDEVIRRCYNLKNNAQMGRIMDRLNPLVRDKMRVVRPMRGLRDEAIKFLIDQILSEVIRRAYIEEVGNEVVTPSTIKPPNISELEFLAAVVETSKDKIM
jgi:hypothetical protein